MYKIKKSKSTLVQTQTKLFVDIPIGVTVENRQHAMQLSYKLSHHSHDRPNSFRAQHRLCN